MVVLVFVLLFVCAVFTVFMCHSLYFFVYSFCVQRYAVLFANWLQS